MISSRTIIKYPVYKVDTRSQLNILPFTSCEIYWKNSSDLQGSWELAVNDSSICSEMLSQYWSSWKLKPNTLFHSSILNTKTVSSNLLEDYPSFPSIQKVRLLFSTPPLLLFEATQEAKQSIYLKVSLGWV